MIDWSPTARRSRTANPAALIEPLESRQLLSTINANPNPSYDNQIHAAQTRAAFGVDGSGMAAAVIDTGIGYSASALGGGYGPGYKVEGGYDLAMNDADPNATGSSHGTMVAGLIASSAPEATGVAPGANLVALRVFGDSNQGSFDTIANALQWVIDHHESEHITVVNLSISDNANYSSDWYSNDGGIGQRIAGLVDRLAALRIPVVTAAGNSFTGAQGMGFIAILPNTISVTATDSNDRLAANAQRLGSSLGGASATDLAAPGVGVTTTGENGSYLQVDGTSFATPIVTGSIILLQSIYHQRFGSLPTVSDLLGWLQRGSVSVTDPATGITLNRLDVARAAALIPAAPTPVTTPAPAPVAPPSTELASPADSAVSTPAQQTQAAATTVATTTKGSSSTVSPGVIQSAAAPGSVAQSASAAHAGPSTSLIASSTTSTRTSLVAPVSLTRAQALRQKQAARKAAQQARRERQLADHAQRPHPRAHLAAALAATARRRLLAASRQG